MSLSATGPGSRCGGGFPTIPTPIPSQVLPRIVASCYPYSNFPMTKGWAEKEPQGDLPSYSKNEGSDIQQFLNFEDEAELLLNGGETAMLRPGD